MSLSPVLEMPSDVRRRVDTLFTDIDDTMTTKGLVPSAAFSALWRAREVGLSVVLVTGRPAGWCDHLARMWPVAAVVGENGALAFAMEGEQIRRIFAPREEAAVQGLERIRQRVLKEVPGCRIAADQAYREYDLAVDFDEEVHLSPEAADEIAAIFREEGAVAKISSIHVNGWYGDHDKLTMCRRASQELLGRELNPDRSVYVGDSPNDEPMFRAFPHAVGVANVRHWVDRMTHLPAYVTEQEGGAGFAEVVAALVQGRQPPVPGGA